MKVFLSATHLALLCMLGLLAMEGEAYAYFDPGTGSMLLQALAVGLMGVAVFWRRLKDIIINFFSRKDKDS